MPSLPWVLTPRWDLDSLPALTCYPFKQKPFPITSFTTALTHPVLGSESTGSIIQRPPFSRCCHAAPHHSTDVAPSPAMPPPCLGQRQSRTLLMLQKMRISKIQKKTAITPVPIRMTISTLVLSSEPVGWEGNHSF